MNPIPANAVDLGTLITQARVLDVEGNQLRLQAGERVFGATLALAFPYKPQIGDVVLAIAQGDEAWVIGVIEGSGVTTFSAPADLEFRATRGRIVLSARDEIEIKSRNVNVVAENAQTLAENLTQQVGNLESIVRQTSILRAAESRTEIEQTCTLRAERVNVRGRKEVKIDGDLINLG
jgi:ABC-type ATPase involved in cell division